jgi:DNA-binding HxlR family transcriptional regulator
MRPEFSAYSAAPSLGSAHSESPYPEVPPRVEYSLTEFGQSLIPLIRELKAWGKKYDEKVIRIKKLQQAGEGRRA